MAYSVPVNVTVVVSFGLFLFYLMGIHNTLINVGGNECEMTYMYEFPQFVEISLPSHIRQANPRYGLFGYAEGIHTEKLRQMTFKGIPVLFIPGSSGSYKQGRSLASISLRKSLDSKSSFHFDYFMVDFNEDQYALYGGTLEQQTKFVRQCIFKIMSLYSKRERRPNSVILIGHSVGGLIAKSVLIDPQFPKSHVKLIISLASPLKAPVLLLDKYIANFYDNVQKYWAENKDKNDTTLISIGGGNKDLLVRSDLTYDMFGHINVLSTAVPGAWCSTDHLNIVWCKQLILTIIRALFDCIHPHTKQMNTNHEYRYQVFNYHLLKKSAGNKFVSDLYQRFVSLDDQALWHEGTLKKFSVVNKKGTRRNTYIMLRLDPEKRYTNLVIETLNLNIKDWIFVCTADKIHREMHICDIGENLSNMTEIAPVLPGSKLYKKFIYLDLPPLRVRNYTHVLISIPKGENYMHVNVDVHYEKTRLINYTVWSVYNPKWETIIRKTAENSIYYKINLIGFETIWQGYILSVETISCKTDKNSAVVSFMIPWAAEHNHFYMKDKKPLSLKLTLTSTRYDYVNDTVYPYIKLSLDPTCTYRVTIRSSITATASQLVIYFTGMLPAYILTVLLLTIREQILHLDEGERVFFHTALCSAVSRYYLIIQATIFGSKILGLEMFLYVLPKPDFSTIDNFNVDVFILSIIVYSIAVIITYSSGIAGYVSVVIVGKTAHKLALKFIAQSIGGLINCSEWFLSFLHQAPIVSSALLVSLALSVSGALSLCIGTVFYFLKISNMYEVYLEDMLQYSLKFFAQKMRNLNKRGRGSEHSERKLPDKEADEQYRKPRASLTATDETDSNGNESDNSMGLSESDILDAGLLWNVHFHVSVFLLWCLITLLNLPSLLVWAKNYNYKFSIEHDPVVVPSIILHTCGSLLWQPGVPHPCRRLSRIFSAILFILAIITVVYASLSLYRLNYFISVTVIVLTVNQWMAKLSY